ncbi:MAG: homoserine dehydrogenase [Gammaproteobacteria bacterium]|nr:homoserine dehydrogenase [Gammaproteobacteria bacterium]MCY4227430.1 homoserine dehydrogenase [Gammaproteobacteria bacterium]MCY4313991.1 homoserine dehydrogenase [Gammaproteobacteria bacterium]
MKAVKIGLLGFGTVGGGTLTVLQRNMEEISRRAGREIKVVAIAVNDLGKKRDIDTGGIELTDRMLDIVNNPDIQVIVELIGGGDDVFNAVMQSLEKGKHVVTANKALIASHGNAIFRKASEKGLMVGFESAVAGGIPIIKLIREGLSANQIEWFVGIINGTCNYILSQMADRQREFDDVLEEAQELGYAEADPSFDVGGVDAAHKLTILASIAFGVPLRFESVYIQGIEHIQKIDIEYADELGFRMKHLGISRRTGDGLELRVHPALIPKQNLIASVSGVMNAVLIQADAVGQSMFYGPGAGSEPTASAVVADLIDVVRAFTTDPQNRVPHLAFQADSLIDLPVLDIGLIETSYYLRMQAVNRPGVLAAISSIFGENEISIDSILQKGHGQPDELVTVILMTQNTREKNLMKAVEKVEALDSVEGKIVWIRVERLP